MQESLLVVLLLLVMLRVVHHISLAGIAALGDRAVYLSTLLPPESKKQIELLGEGGRISDGGR